MWDFAGEIATLGLFSLREGCFHDMLGELLKSSTSLEPSN
jgi:hypothetical protein